MQIFMQSAQLLNCQGSIADVAETQHKSIMAAFREKLEINILNKQKLGKNDK
jgi:hypothetical protein